MRRHATALVLLAACGADRADETRTYAAGTATRLVVDASGPVTLRTATTPEVRVSSPQPADVQADAKAIRVNGARGARIVVTAPRGIELVVRHAGAEPVEIEGEWGPLTVRTEGPVAIAAAIGGGLVESRAGNLSCALRGTIAKSLRLSTYRGKALDLELTDAYRGLLNLTTERGAIAVPNDPRLRWRHGAQGKSVLGFCGPRWEGDEALGADKRPGIWATAPEGQVTLAFAKR